jgi:chitodextrinase
MRSKKARNDTQSPSAPTGLTVSGASASGLTLSWSASSDTRGVAGYDLYLNGSEIGTTAATSYGFSGLSCGLSYTLAVDAYDAAGNRSPQASVQASSSPCLDTQAPATPLWLVETSATASSISLSWASVLDNIGVAGYTIYLNGSKAGTTGLTLYGITNLACGQSYTLAVDAYDAAGNHSQQTSVVASTAPCLLPPSSTALPAISGSTTVGSTLSATPGAWSGSPTGYRYQWRRCDSAGNNCSDISGAGTNSYALTAADQMATLRVAVMATNAGGSSTASSIPTAVIAAAPSAPGTPSTPADFSFDPNLTGSLLPWERFDPGDAAATNGINVSTAPNGATSPGIVRIVNDPLAQQGKVLEETVTPTAHASNAAGSDSTYLWNITRTPYLGNNGQSNWVHFRLMFPSGYQPTPGEWNVENEFHNNSNYMQWVNSGYMTWEYPEVALYVTNYTGDVPRLMYRVRGGVDQQGSDNYAGTDIRVPAQLQLNHWYDVLLHIAWSPDPNLGQFEWWLDGQQMASIHRPTLWQRPDGSYDHTDVELNNYRQHATWNATVYYGRLKVGSTQASVGF